MKQTVKITDPLHLRTSDIALAYHAKANNRLFTGAFTPSRHSYAVGKPLPRAADVYGFDVREDNVVVARRGRCRRDAGDYLTTTLPRDHETNTTSQSCGRCLK